MIESAPVRRRQRRRPQPLASLIDGVLKRLRAGLEADEAIHDLRVACRRLEAGTRVSAGVLPRRRLRRVRRAAQAIRRAYDRARDLEVIAAELGAVPGLSEGFRAATAVAAQAGAVAAGEAADAVEVLERARAKLDADAVPARSTLSAVLGEHIDAFFDELERLQPESTDAALHNVRIATKRLRYELEVGAPVLRRLPAQITRLKRLQDILGRHQDAAVGLVWAERLTAGELESTPSDRAALMRYYDGLRRTQRQRLRRLLNGWRKAEMRQRFLKAVGAAPTPESSPPLSAVGSVTGTAAPVSLEMSHGLSG